MEGADGSKHFGGDLPSQEQSPSLLTIILDTNPAAWALLHPTLTLSSAIADILVFINAHLACNFTNQIAIIASHCDKAQWLYPTSAAQKPPGHKHGRVRTTQHETEDEDDDDIQPASNKRAKLNGIPKTDHGLPSSMSESESKKYRPFRMIEEEFIKNLQSLISGTSPETIQQKTSTMVAGALTLALSYINRRSQEYQESMTGVSSNLADQAVAAGSDPHADTASVLQSRILVITLSPSTDLAHQYIPMMNAIFACQRLNILIDVLQLPLPPDLKQPGANNVSDASTKSSQSSTVFLQQASDATHGIFIAARLESTTDSKSSSRQTGSNAGDGDATSLARYSMLTYLLTSLLPTPTSRLHLITPTRVDVDFRAACFCHRNVISTGFVCSICLSIFCDQSLEILSQEGCITCGTKLSVRAEGVGGWGGGKRPIVVAPKKKKKKKGLGSAVGTPRPETPA
ncbi:RNA polymerase II transcription factor B subunit 4 [Lithohypha guttulata]|uniref:General transcription and DNA repair factor IIH subunit TFB4 n=1 Tax=Lithohypha guttulata TaxID=1690604 RepID=A0AAN7T066_9EURO|nr:RNA polymerase II transcription factor B subunit 4 [Lithohypha guttulata]